MNNQFPEGFQWHDIFAIVLWAVLASAMMLVVSRVFQ
jgi:hypothetical protein